MSRFEPGDKVTPNQEIWASGIRKPGDKAVVVRKGMNKDGWFMCYIRFLDSNMVEEFGDEIAEQMFDIVAKVEYLPVPKGMESWMENVKRYIQ